jgi:type VI secretion system secreted protein VgrG
MASSLRQDKHIARLDTPGGQDKLVLTSFECVEGVSELFEYRIDALSREGNIDFDPMLGRNCTITFNTQDGGKRFFDGILAEARWLGPTGTKKEEEHGYSLVLRPWLWVLSFRRNCLIFHEKTAPKIIEEIFGKHGFADFKNNLSRDYPTLEYCVQYRESDMAFVCRLMEQHGISYYFEHSEGAHKLILADEASTFKTIDGSSRRFSPGSVDFAGKKETVRSIIPRRSFTSGKVKLKDYDFKKPSADLTAEKTGDAKFDKGKLEVYDSPGKYVERADGVDYATARLNMERAVDDHFHATGDCVSCFPGALVSLTGHPEGKLNQEYIALRCVHTFSGLHYGLSGATDAVTYEGKYELVKSDKPYAPPLLTETPFIGGAQTAEVVGDGEIDVDKYGRILVRFHWDTQEDKSMRCRIAQVWSGKQWGGIFIPRIGMEVVVQFLEGNPDQPLVIGTVYNNENMPPYKLPDNKTIAGLKSNSSTGGGGYNEFIFEDKAGKELVRMNAQKDLKSTVGNDETRSIKNDRSTNVDRNDTLNVDDTLKITATNKVEITVGNSKITMVPDKITIESLNVEIKAMDLKTTTVTSEHEASAMMDIKGGVVKINS